MSSSALRKVAYVKWNRGIVGEREIGGAWSHGSTKYPFLTLYQGRDAEQSQVYVTSLVPQEALLALVLTRTWGDCSGKKWHTSWLDPIAARRDPVSTAFRRLTSYGRKNLFCPSFGVFRQGQLCKRNSI